MTATREAIFSALFTRLQGAYGWQYSSRRLKLWGDVPLENRPALFQFEGRPELYKYTSGGVLASQARTLRAAVFAYTNAKDMTTVGSTQINNMLDAIDAALQPSGADWATGQNSLGNLVDSCRIADVPLRDPGDLDGDGVVIVVIDILLP